MHPLIGISCSYDQKEERFFIADAYCEAVVKSGGYPVILPGIAGVKISRPYLAAVNGLILTGGGDVDPVYFNEEPQLGLGEITPDRDRFEIMLVKAALRKNIPILGICRGAQVLNIACGGTVIQHIPSGVRKPLKHFQSAPRWYPTHKITVADNSRLAKIMGIRVARVNSFHHQAVRQPAPGFTACARSSDEVIEAIEHPGYRFVIGVQWHPECMVDKDKNSAQLFREFIAAAGSRSKKQ